VILGIVHCVFLYSNMAVAKDAEGEERPTRWSSLEIRLTELLRVAAAQPTGGPLPGARPFPRFRVQDLLPKVLGPRDLTELPICQGQWTLDTTSGSRHVIARGSDGDITWTRLPSETSGVTPFDGMAIPVRELRSGWHPGERGFMILEDETEFMTPTTIHTAMILRIYDASIDASAGDGDAVDE